MLGPVRARIGVALTAALALGSAEARADVNAGVWGGVGQRISETPSLAPGVALGAHGEISLVPFVRIGVQYLFEAVDPIEPEGDATFVHAFGPRVRGMLPIPGTDFLPFLELGFGVAIAQYDAATGAFLEVPIGLGIAWELEALVQIALAGHARPSFAGFGAAYSDDPDDPDLGVPVFGWDASLGVALEL